MQIIGSEMDPLKDFLLRATLFIFVDGELKTPYLKMAKSHLTLQFLIIQYIWSYYITRIMTNVFSIRKSH